MIPFFYILPFNLVLYRKAGYNVSNGRIQNAKLKSLNKRTDFFNANGWLFTITDSKFDVQTGHAVNWQLDWDSSKITGGVGTDKTI